MHEIEGKLESKFFSFSLKNTQNFLNLRKKNIKKVLNLNFF